jgi:YHS domain-containing protein
LLFLLRLLTILGVFWILRRLLGFFTGRPSEPARRSQEGPVRTDTVKDPVCGMYMDPRLAIRLPRHEGDVFFCSEECRNKYLNGSIVSQ